MYGHWQLAHRAQAYGHLWSHTPPILCTLAIRFLVSARMTTVDKHLGIVLTNRHVVTTGPVKLELTLLNNEGP